MNNIAELYDLGLQEDRVVLSLENKTLTSRFEKWQILEEPVEDIHSLMYYSRAVVSDGDSMAREGAQLGVPAVYCGQRIMRANQALEQFGYLRHEPDPHQALAAIRELGDEDNAESAQQARREHLLAERADPTDVVLGVLGELVGADLLGPSVTTL